ncbi:MAG TPA: VOC family protein [Dictyobacter sp.]|jgi:catechol-2,3-dioxygenase|nr:VOC family protein [Dictyobacter sp.]
MSNQQIQKVKVRRLAQVGLWSTDVVSAARFYWQILGLDIVRTAATATEDDIENEDVNMVLASSDGSQCLGLFTDTRSTQNYNHARKGIQRTPLHHLTFEVDTEAELAALAARLKMSGVELTLSPRDGDLDQSDVLWFTDPDGNHIEVSTASDELSVQSQGRSTRVRPVMLQHVALYTLHLEAMVDFYTDALGFDISDWLLRERAWLRCNNNHHTLMLIQGAPAIDHLGFQLAGEEEIIRWADYLSQHQVSLVWGPGRHGTSNDLFLRFVDSDSIHVELSAGMAQYYDRDVTIPPRLWHTRTVALNLWGLLPPWISEKS